MCPPSPVRRFYRTADSEFFFFFAKKSQGVRDRVGTSAKCWERFPKILVSLALVVDIMCAWRQRPLYPRTGLLTPAYGARTVELPSVKGEGKG